MKKKLWFIGILLMSIFISSSKCSDDDKEEHKYITIINLSNKAIVWQPQMVKIGEVDAQYACRLNGINTFEYFTDILNRMAYINPNASDEVYQKLLPNFWTKE